MYVSLFIFKPVSLPAKRLKKSLSTGRIDLWIGIKPADDIKQQVLIGQQQVSSVKLNLYSLHTMKAVKLVDLQDKEVIMIRGYSYGGFADFLNDKNNNITVFLTNTHESAFGMLSQKRANYLLAYQQPAEQVLQQKAINNLHSHNLSTLPLYLVLSKRVQQADRVIQKLEKTLLKIDCDS